MSVSKRLRYEVLRRDNHRCRYCGVTADEVRLVVDHVVPTSLGGSDEPDNLVASCADCNSGKSSASPDASQVADVEQDAIRWSQAMEHAAQAQAQEDLHARRFRDIVKDSWQAAFERDVHIEDGEFSYPNDPERKFMWAVFLDGKPKEAFDLEVDADDYAEKLRSKTVPPKDTDWEEACRAWCAAGLTIDDAQKMIMATVRKKNVAIEERWRYFCGCMWSRLTERQKIAKDLLAAEEE